MAKRKGLRVRKSPAPSPATFTVTPLVPKSPSTQAVYLVRETKGLKEEKHIVLYDRWGVYCESHGKECPSVAPAQKQHSRLSKKGR